MANFIVAVAILTILGVAIAYIIKEKKRGVKCIGCPAGAECSHGHSGASGCGGNCGSCGGCHTEVE